MSQKILYFQLIGQRLVPTKPLWYVCYWHSFIILIVLHTNVTATPSNMNIILFVGMGACSNPSKFQKNNTYKS